MARNTLSLLQHPGFSQLLDSIIERDYQIVERVLARYQLDSPAPTTAATSSAQTKEN